MIQILQPLLSSSVGCGIPGGGLDGLIEILLIYLALLALGVALMTCQGAALVWLWRTSGRVDTEQDLRDRWAKIFKVVNWLWLGAMGGIGYLIRNEGPFSDMWLVWCPLALFAAMTVLHLMSLHRHAGVSFALLVSVLFYAQMVVPTVTSRLQDRMHKDQIQRLLRPEEVANRERFQREEFGKQQQAARVALMSRTIDETTRSLIRIRDLLLNGRAIGDAERVELRKHFINRVYACHKMRLTLEHGYAYQYRDRNDLLKHYMLMIVNWDHGPWFEGESAREVEELRRYVSELPSGSRSDTR